MTTTTKDQQEAIEKAEKAISLAFNKILIQQPAMLMFLNHADLKPIFKEGLTVRINTQSSIMNAYLEYNPDFINTIEDNSVLRSEEHTSELQSRPHLVCRLLLEKK